MSISFIYCYARSGGTLLNRCLNSLKDVVVLSEVHPVYDSARALSSTMSISRQAKQWHGIELKADNYLDQILELHAWCLEHRKHLVVRDWTFADFTPNNFNGFQPPNRSTSFELLRDAVPLKTIAFVRDAIDVGLSRQVALGEFSRSYIHYVNFLVRNQVQLVRYEDFCRYPSATMTTICNLLGLPGPDREALSCDSLNVIGDIGFSRGNRNQSVVELKRKYVPASRRHEIDQDPYLMQCNRLLGYPTAYSARRSEGLVETVAFNLISPFGLLKKRLQRKLSRTL